MGCCCCVFPFRGQTGETPALGECCRSTRVPVVLDQVLRVPRVCAFGCVCCVYACFRDQLLPEGSLAHQILAWFFVSWWMATAGAGTFSSPFTTTGNGYFAAWGGFLFSVVFLSMTSPLFKQSADKLKSALVSASFGDQIGLILCSILCLVDASVQFGGCVPPYTSVCLVGYNAYAISVSCVSIILTAVTIFLVTSAQTNPTFVRAFAWITAFL
jgi:hypothetical protein